jgi:hypothetical protein
MAKAKSGSGVDQERSTASSRANRMPLPCWRPRNVLARMNRARNFPVGTDPSSRHAAMIAEALIRRGEYSMLLSEPEHCGVSIAATVEMLWKARAEIAALRSRLSRDGNAQ